MDKMKNKIVKRLNEIIFEIIYADEKGLAEIGAELLEIEKKILAYGVKTPINYKPFDKNKNL